MRYLALSEVLRLHADLVATSGGATGVRDLGRVQAALAQPMATFGGEDLCPAIADKAAALGFALVQGHAFIDGNKRIGHAAMEVFLVFADGSAWAQGQPSHLIGGTLAAGLSPPGLAATAGSGGVEGAPSRRWLPSMAPMAPMFLVNPLQSWHPFAMALPGGINTEKLAEVALALLSLTSFRDGSDVRAWKGLDWDVLDLLHGRGWIEDPKGKAKSVVLTEEGHRLAGEALAKHFGQGSRA